MLSRTLIEAILLVTVVSVVVSSRAPEPLYSVLIQPPQNASLCVRTKAFESEGAQMKLLECGRPYQFYDGQRTHRVVQYDGFEGFKIETTWAPEPDSYGIRGCFYPLNGRIRARFCHDNVPQEFWNIIELEAEQPSYQVQSVSTRKCIGVPEIKDEVALGEVECDPTDPRQRWRFVIDQK